jgi:hypothetical protein
MKWIVKNGTQNVYEAPQHWPKRLCAGLNKAKAVVVIMLLQSSPWRIRLARSATQED